MVIEEIKFINDVIQDARIDARIQEKYDMLIFCILKNAKLNWNNEGLTFKSDEKLFNLVEVLEPERYLNAFKEAYSNENNKKKE